MDLTAAQIDQLATAVRDYQITHGSLLKLVKYQASNKTVPARPVNVSLVPSAFPAHLFKHALDLQQHFDDLYIRLSNDHVFLESLLGPLVIHNDFIRSLWEIFVEAESAQTQNIVCGVFRSDYMVHRPSMSLKQVEMNSFSVSGACHVDRVAEMHRHMQHEFPTKPLVSLPENNNTSSIVDMLALAHQYYTPLSQNKVCLLMIVQGMNFNICDERPLEYALHDRGVSMFRLEWNEVLKRTSLDRSREQTLFYTDPWSGDRHEVSVVYYRAGYEAREYQGPGKATRLHLEQSRAIKCPDILTHITTLKSVQTALTGTDTLERYLNHQPASSVRETFMPMQTLDSSHLGLEARRLTTDRTKIADYILKPNLEGGGHNVYGADIPNFLDTVPQIQWGDYTIMRMIEPPETYGILQMSDESYQGPVVNELGVIGVCLWRRHDESVEIISNKVAGWTFKTKPAGVKEMNVVKGNGCFDCPSLI